LTLAQLEERRLAAAALLRRGLTQAAIARHLGVSRASVSRWAAALHQQGRHALRARPKSGRPPRLAARAWARLDRLLARGARAAGFESERWTLRRIAVLIEREFGVRDHPRYLERPLKAHGFTVQRPASRAKERDELVIARWPKRDWVALKKTRTAKLAGVLRSPVWRGRHQDRGGSGFAASGSGAADRASGALDATARD
jgi:transposase